MEELDVLYARYPALAALDGDLRQGYAMLLDTVEKEGTILVCGNGGSAADSAHIVGELMKSFKRRRPIPQAEQDMLQAQFGEEGLRLGKALEGAIKAIALPQNLSLNTALSNDTDAAVVYAQQVYGLGKAGDTLLVISTSGNAENCVLAAMAAKLRGMHTVGLTGMGGGRLQGICDVTIRVPATETYQVQELHLPVYHCLCAMLERAWFA